MSAPITEYVDVNVTLSGTTSAATRDYGALMLVGPHTVTANRQDGPYATLQAAEGDGFTSAAVPDIHAMLVDAFAQEHATGTVYIGRQDAADAGDYSVTLDAITTDTGFIQVWMIAIDSKTQADIEDVAAWLATRDYCYAALTNDAAVPDGTASNVAENLQTSDGERTVLFAHDVAADRVDAAWASEVCGADLGNQFAAAFGGFVQCASLTPNSYTETEHTTIFGYDANAYGQTRNLPFVSKGTTSSGVAYHLRLLQSYFKDRMESRLLETLVDAYPKLGMSPGGLSVIQAAAQGIIDGLVSAGAFLPNTPDTPIELNVPLLRNISAADKRDGIVRITASAYAVNQMQKIVFNMNIQVA